MSMDQDSLSICGLPLGFNLSRNVFASNVYSIVFRDFVDNMLKRSEGNLQVFFEVSLLFRLKLPVILTLS